MKFRFKTGLAAAAVVCIGLSGCGYKQAEPEETQVMDYAAEDAVEKATPSAADYKLRDKDAVYEDDDEDSVITMYLTVREGNETEHTNHTWAEVNTYSKYWYDDNNIPQYAVEGILQVGDENGPLPGELGYGLDTPNAIVKIRGQTSSKGAQKNYKVELKKEKGEWRGQRTINLNKHMGDGLRFRNKLAYDLIKEVPQMVAARTQFVHLYVKDETEGGSGAFEDYGLYTQVEQINKTFLKTHGLDKNGQLYKIEFFEYFRYEDVLRLATDPKYDLTEFEEYLEVKGDNDHSKLIAMLEDVNDYSIPIERTVEKWFDTENLFYWMGFHILMGNDDTNARNYFLYSPLNVDKFFIISWDNDVSLMTMESNVEGRISEGGWEHGISNYWGNMLYQRLFKNEKYRKELTEAIENLKSGYLTPEHMNEKINAYRAVVKPFVYQMPDVLHAPLTEAEYDQVADNLTLEVEENYKTYLESLEKPMPFFIALPQLENGKLKVNWDAAYDFDGENITYTAAVATDYEFTNIIHEEKDIRIPQIETEPLPPGQYFVKVQAKNESGKTQDAFDYYVTDLGKIYGVSCFYVLEDGSIGADIYNEGA